MTRRAPRFFAISATAAALALTGCGIQDQIVHLQPAPTENAEVGAPLRFDAAERIATRVLAQAAEATDVEQRQAIMVAPSLRIANARAEAASDTPSETGDLTIQPTPTVLAVSSGKEWPRAILAATLDEGTQVQSLHVLVSTGPTAQFQLKATASMLPGTAVPALGEFNDGATYEAATKDSPIQGTEILDAYGKGLAFPTPAATDLVSFEDPFAESLKRNAKAQNDALDDLANLAQTRALMPDSVVSFSTADGGEVVFGQSVRRDRITLTDKAKDMPITDERLQELSGKEKVTKHFWLESLENLLFVVPAEGEATLIGAEEVLLRAAGDD